jgi:hypothetical protein
LDQLFSLFEEQRKGALECQRQIGEIAEEATAPRMAVSVTVGAHGQIKGLSFPTEAYKDMAPAELAAAVRETYDKAREKALQKLGVLVGPRLPPGVSVHDLIDGKAGVEQFLSDELPQALRSALVPPGDESRSGRVQW